MSLKKYKISLQKRGQSIVEYILLVAIAILGLVGATNFISYLKDNAFETHFQKAAWYIGNVTPPSP
jgi:uncharacterized protein (UPF0333 family)